MSDLELEVKLLREANEKLKSRLARAITYTQQNHKPRDPFARYLVKILNGTLDNG